MCGLVAIFNYHSAAHPIDEAELFRVREAMVPRGPDGAGLWLSQDRCIGLAHRRLAIIDLSESGAQPMATADGSLRIVFNGEIYNFRALREQLEGKGYRFVSHSDTEVLLHLYRDAGRDMVRHLRGMYAFAIWDESKRGIFMARDPFGIKPLYYSDNGRTIRVASQVKALLKGGQVDTSQEPAGHVGFYLWGHVPEPYTLYRGVRCLPGGTTLWVDADGRKDMRSFFNIADEIAQAEEDALRLTPAQTTAHLREALLDSVRHHLVADVPVGAFLSAGLDSTTLVALAREAGVRDLHTVTLGFKEFRGTPNDEVPLAELVAQRYSTVHHTEWVTQNDFANDYEHLMAAMDQPTIDGVNSYFVSKAAKQAGLKVVLSGLGGDELFGGYPSFHQIPKMVRMLAPLQATPLLGRGFRYLASPIVKRYTSPKYAGLLEYGGSYGGAYLIRRGLYMPWELPDVLDADLLREGWRELQTLGRLQQTTDGIGNPHLKVSALETAWYMRNQLLRDSDWASMAHSVELRVPLVDYKLFKIVVSLLSSGSGLGKRGMAHAPSLPLPAQVLNRPKTGFTIPVRQWILGDANGPAISRARGARGWAQRVYSSALVPV